MRGQIVEAFKDAKALVTDILTAPFESSVEIYKSMRADGGLAGSGQGLNPVQAAGAVIGFKVLENAMALPAFLAAPDKPLFGASMLVVNQLLMGNVTANVIRSSYRKPAWPRTAARNAARHGTTTLTT